MDHIHESATTTNMPLQDARFITRDWWAENHILVDLDSSAITSDLDAVIEYAAREGIGSLGSMLHHARQVITGITGVETPHAFSAPATSDHVHRIRNAMGALLTATEQITQPEPVPKDLLFRLPIVAERSGGRERPLTDDEIVLIRSDAMYCLRHQKGPHRLPAVQYALADSGARPYETTQVTPDDFDDVRNPTRVQVHGSGQLAKARRLDLNAWSSEILAAAMDTHLAHHPHANYIPLGYSGRSGPSSASASASGVLTRCMRRSGIGTTRETSQNWQKQRGTEPTATAITRWRVQKTLDAQGPIAALQIMGRYDPRNLRIGILHDFLNLTTATEVDEPTAERQSFKGL